jgi:hypothetical protein
MGRRWEERIGCLMMEMGYFRHSTMIEWWRRRAQRARGRVRCRVNEWGVRYLHHRMWLDRCCSTVMWLGVEITRWDSCKREMVTPPCHHSSPWGTCMAEYLVLVSTPAVIRIIAQVVGLLPSRASTILDNTSSTIYSIVIINHILLIIGRLRMNQCSQANTSSSSC